MYWHFIIQMFNIVINVDVTFTEMRHMARFKWDFCYREYLVRGAAARIICLSLLLEKNMIVHTCPNQWKYVSKHLLPLYSFGDSLKEVENMIKFPYWFMLFAAHFPRIYFLNKLFQLIRIYLPGNTWFM